MKKISYLLMLCGALLTVACGKSDDSVIDEPPTTPEQPGGNKDGREDPAVVTFVPYLSAPTRATDTAFDTNDKIGVYAVESSGSDNRAIIGANGSNYADNVPYYYDGSRFKPVNKGIEIPTNGKLYYTAVYPYAVNIRNEFTFVVSSNQTSYESYTLSDLCTASTNATAEKEVDLRFSHRLSKIVLNLSGDGWNSSDIQVKLKNVMTNAYVNLNDLTFTATGSKSDVICSSNGTHSYKVILPPQTIGAGEKFFVITMNGVDYTLDTPGQIELRSGKAYEYTLMMDTNHEIVTFTGDINPWNSDERIDEVVPKDIQDELDPYIPIYKGNTPPNIEGSYYINPFETVYCEDYGSGGYATGTIVESVYVRFSNQNSIYNTIDFEETNANGTSQEVGTGAFISGTGNNFTAFFNTIGQTDGISTKTALVVSGTKTAGGIANLKYAFIMVDKGADPNNHLMSKGVFRVFQDKDAMSEKATWPLHNSPARRNAKSSMTTAWSMYKNVK